MFLHRIHLDPRCRAARRDLSDPYQLHSTLCRAFCEPNEKCPEGEFLWRLEPETNVVGYPRVLVQSKTLPNWSAIKVQGWLAMTEPAVDVKAKLKLDSLKVGQHFRFRMRANPCVTRSGKRMGLMKMEEQEKWIERKAQKHGFSLPHLPSFGESESSRPRVDVRISQGQMIRGRPRVGNEIRIYSALYDGIVTVKDADTFKLALQTGIGHGKVMGLGLLSVAPITSEKS